jgi:hypothetical protein
LASSRRDPKYWFGMKSVLFLVPDGTGVRNYLYASLLKELKGRSTFSIWTPLPKEAIDEVAAIHNISYSYQHIVLERENFKTKLYREAAKYARLINNTKHFNNPTIVKYNWNHTPKGIKLKVFNTFTTFLGSRISKKYPTILRFEENSRKHWPDSIIDSYKEQLKKENPSVIFITHQRVFSLNPICIAAQDLGIPVVSCIYSWDNVVKASLAIAADTYVVWSDLMKQELELLYPEIPHSQIIVTGSPQFEFYLEEHRKISREEFATLYGLDLTKKWICFSGDDIRTSPYDAMYLEDVAKAVKELKEPIQIVFRRCPVDYSNRYDAVIETYKDSIVVIDPKWYTKSDSWSTVYPKKEDVDLLVNVVYHCELVLNLGSTMAHDFAVFNKPCLYFKYNPEKNTKWSVKDVYQYHHFTSMQDLDAVGWLEDKSEITTKISEALKNPLLVGKDRSQWMQRIVRHPLHEASRLIAKTLVP